MKISIIGMGAMGGTHNAMLNEHTDHKVAIICDANESKLKKPNGEEYLAEIKTTNITEAIDGADLVIVATPTNTHAAIALEAIRKDKIVFCQKPLARTLDEAKEIMNEVRAHGKQFQVGYIMRYSGVWNKVKEMMTKIGPNPLWREIWHINGQAYPGWLFAEDGGGCVFEDSHRLEFLCHALGKPLKVYAFVESYTSKYQDTMVAVITFERGKAMFSDSWAREGPGTSNRKPRVMFDVIGPEGHIVHPVDGNATVLYDKNGNEQERIAWDHLGISGYVEEMKGFMSHVTEGAPMNGCTLEEGVQVIALIDAIQRSAAEGKEVNVENIQ